MALGVFRVARRYMCWFVGDIVAGVRGIGGSGVRPLGFQGEWGCGLCFCCLLPCLFGWNWWYGFWGVHDGEPFGVILHVERVAVLWSWKAGRKYNIHWWEFGRDMIFGRSALRACGSPCMWCYVGRFLVLHSSGLMFSFLWGRGGGSGSGGWIVSSPGGVPASRVGLFLLCFACPPWLRLRPGAYVSGLVGVFLGLSVGAVWVRLITGRL